MTDSSDVLMELLTLTLTVDQWGNRIYRNSLDELHRQHGPALECTNGAKYWFLDGQRHRTDGPAIENPSGDKYWFLDGQRHRTTGPAVERSNGDKEWFLDGEQLTEREFHARIK